VQTFVLHVLAIVLYELLDSHCLDERSSDNGAVLAAVLAATNEGKSRGALEGADATTAVLATADT
jgi:hypothetical protein